MANVAKWLRHLLVVQGIEGSIPFIRPFALSPLLYAIAP